MTNAFIDLDKYIVGAHIGDGPQGKVYMLDSKANEKSHAIKIFKKTLETDEFSPAEKKKLIEDINYLILLKYPSITSFIDFIPIYFNKVQSSAIVSELVSTKSLQQVFQVKSEKKSSKYYNDTSKLITIYGIAKAMSYLHSREIIHCNLKPDNILLTKKFHPYITDFALSNYTHNISNLKNIDLAQLVHGTTLYLPPEFFDKYEYTKEGDVYAFSMIVYEIMCDKKPFNDQPYLTVIQKTQKGTRPKIVETVPTAYRNLIKKCWHRDPKKRPTFDQIVKELDQNQDFLTETVEKGKFYAYEEIFHKYQSKNKRVGAYKFDQFEEFELKDEEVEKKKKKGKKKKKNSQLDKAKSENSIKGKTSKNAKDKDKDEKNAKLKKSNSADLRTKGKDDDSKAKGAKLAKSKSGDIKLKEKNEDSKSKKTKSDAEEDKDKKSKKAKSDAEEDKDKKSKKAKSDAEEGKDKKSKKAKSDAEEGKDKKSKSKKSKSGKKEDESESENSEAEENSNNENQEEQKPLENQEVKQEPKVETPVEPLVERDIEVVELKEDADEIVESEQTKEEEEEESEEEHDGRLRRNKAMKYDIRHTMLEHFIRKERNYRDSIIKLDIACDKLKDGRNFEMTYRSAKALYDETFYAVQLSTKLELLRQQLDDEENGIFIKKDDDIEEIQEEEEESEVSEVFKNDKTEKKQENQEEAKENQENQENKDDDKEENKENKDENNKEENKGENQDNKEDNKDDKKIKFQLRKEVRLYDPAVKNVTNIKIFLEYRKKALEIMENVADNCNTEYISKHALFLHNSHPVEPPNYERIGKLTKMAGFEGDLLCMQHYLSLLRDRKVINKDFYELGQLFEKLSTIEREHSLEQRADQHYLKAAEFYKKAAGKNHLDGMFRYAQMLEEGKAEAPTEEEKLLKQKKNKTKEEIEKLEKITNDRQEKIIKLYRKAAQLGHAGSLYKCALMIENVENRTRADTVKASELYKKAAYLNYPDAMFRYAQILEDICMIKSDRQKAIELYQKAAYMNHPDSMFRYAQLLEEGFHVRADKMMALEFYRRAANSRRLEYVKHYATIARSGSLGLIDLADADKYDKILEELTTDDAK